MLVSVARNYELAKCTDFQTLFLLLVHFIFFFSHTCTCILVGRYLFLTPILKSRFLDVWGFFWYVFLLIFFSVIYYIEDIITFSIR